MRSAPTLPPRAHRSGQRDAGRGDVAAALVRQLAPEADAAWILDGLEAAAWVASATGPEVRSC